MAQERQESFAVSTKEKIEAAQKAAERYRAGVYEDHRPATFPTWSWHLHKDMQAMQQGWLAEHPTDDQTPLDLDWMCKVLKRDSAGNFMLGPVGTFDIYLGFSDRQFRFAVYQQRTPLVLSVRGDVRMLARALKIDLGESL